MTAIETMIGPMMRPIPAYGAFSTGYPLDDADDAVAWKFCVPKDGSITKVGFLVMAVTGSPPAYNVGLVNLDSSGDPTTTAYGGSAPASYTPSATGWIWITLATPATANASDFCAARVWPTGTAPDASNNVSINRDLVMGSVSAGTAEFPTSLRYVTSWSLESGPTPFAVQYSTDFIFGNSVEDRVLDDTWQNSTPDEIGNLFTLPFTAICRGVRLATWGTGGSTVIKLYDSSDNLLTSVPSFDADYLDSAELIVVYWDEITLIEGAQYRITVAGTTDNSGLGTVSWIFDTAADRACLPDGLIFQRTERTNGGAWTNTDTKIALISPLLVYITVPSDPGQGGQYGFVS